MRQNPIGEGYPLLQCKGQTSLPHRKQSLLERPGGYIQDDFSHEQNLVIREDGISLLVSGCSHKGIVNIVDQFYNLYGHYPTHVI